jgi:sugar phosphate isomerase/epimerase
MGSLLKCDVCRSYYDDVDGHRCPGLRSVDWARFMHSLREWMASDPYAQFEVFYARRREAARDR